MIRILLADDQDLLCEILQTSLESQSDLQIVGRANNGEVAVEKVDVLRPDIALIDINMPVMDGLIATQKIAQNFPETKVIILSGSDSKSDFDSAISVGAKSYISKTAKASEIINQIRSVYHEGHVASPESELSEIMMQINQVKKEFKGYAQQVDLKLKRVEQTETKLKHLFDNLSSKNGKSPIDSTALKSTIEPIIQDLHRVVKESKQHSTEISRIQTLLEGQLSYVHSLNKRAKSVRQYLLGACGLATLALILSIISLLS